MITTTKDDPLRPKLTRRPRKVRARTYRNKERPHLRFVVNYREAGERRRRYFETQAEAAQFAWDKNEERKNFGMAAGDLSLSTRGMAMEAVEALTPFGRTIRDAVAHYVAHLKARERSCSAEQL